MRKEKLKKQVRRIETVKAKKQAAKRIPPTEEELTKLAKDLVANQVFMSDQIRNPNDFGMVFPVLMMMDRVDLLAWKEAGVCVFYAYLKDALPSGVNGYPMFMSAAGLTKSEYEYVVAKEKMMREAIESVGAMSPEKVP